MANYKYIKPKPRSQSSHRADFRRAWEHLDGNGRVEMLLWLQEDQDVEYCDGFAIIRTDAGLGTV